MNKKMILYTLSRLLLLEGLLMLLPAVTSLIYREWVSALSFSACAAACAAVGGITALLTRKTDTRMYAREGFIIVALAWVMISAVGAVPFVLSGEIPSYADAFFETVSGFTTTGASVLTNVEAMSRGCLIWRAFSHWIGGMGVLVLMLAVTPSGSDARSMHIMRAEMPGPKIDKIVPKAKDTAKLLYVIYIILTLVEVVFLLFGGLDLFESLFYSFGTAGTGGFGMRSDSLGSYSMYVKWVITAFMLIFGVNFYLFYLITMRKFRQAAKSEELRVYLAVVVLCSAAIALNIYPAVRDVGKAVTDSAFQVVSIITTTGYSTVDFNLWPDFSKTVLFILMFVGGCAGSTAGGLKMSRIIILFKTVGREFKSLLHPRSVGSVRFEGKALDKEVKSSVLTYFALYFIVFAALFAVLSLEKFSFETNLTALTACFNNVGPGLGDVGPMGSFAGYSAWAKYLLSAAMLLGRLEIYPLLLTIAPSTWTRKY